jgi:excisionase family DNA binding protein
MTAFDKDATLTPTAQDALLARESSRRLSARTPGKLPGVRIQLLDEPEGSEPLVVPASALRLFQRMLAEVSQGQAVTLLPARAELTSQQAADLLNVSRPFLVKLLEDGAIPFRVVGKHRRVRLDDLMAYKRKDDEARARVLDQLAAEAQELGMGY